jgi:hypothetical protein
MQAVAVVAIEMVIPVVPEAMAAEDQAQFIQTKHQVLELPIQVVVVVVVMVKVVCTMVVVVPADQGLLF